MRDDEHPLEGGQGPEVDQVQEQAGREAIPDAWIAPKHDPFDPPDAEDEADTRERVLEGGEDAGDADAARVRRELGMD